MLLDKIKNILPHYVSDYPSDFQKIIKNIYPSSDHDDNKVLFIWEAYCFSKNAHEGQMRHSGKPTLLIAHLWGLHSLSGKWILGPLLRDCCML